jgi:CubicO group peptidase (beta-lactamase class C family)
LFSLSYSYGQTLKNNRKVASLEKSLERVMNLSNAAGMSVAVVKGDKIIYAKGFGYSDYENKVPADANTLFAIGSCTKAFTGAVIGQLEADEKVDIDESVRDYLPALKFYNDEMNRIVTPRDMLSHRTGLPRHDLSWYMFPSTSRDTLIARIQHQEPTLEVRESFQYNNFMFMALGALAEEVSGKSWETNVEENLFKPLQMNRSNLHISELEKTENVALGYSTSSEGKPEKEDYYRIRGMAPAGSINSSAMDMGNWLISWLNEGEFQGEEVIPSSYVAEAMSSQVAASGGTPGPKRPELHFNNYGFGWSLSSYRGHYRVEHGGNIDGFTASNCFFPSDDIGIVVLANQNNSRVPALVRNMIADKMLGLKSGKWDETLKELAKEAEEEEEEESDDVSSTSGAVKGTKYSHALKDYTGRFNHPGYGTIIVEQTNDSLFAVLPERKWWLKHYHYDVFEPFEMDENGVDTTGGSSIKFNFRTDNMGDLAGFNLNAEYGLDPLFFKREFVEVEMAASDLEKYVGAYEMGGTEAKIFIKDENSLRLFVPGQPEYTLIAAGDNSFKIKDLEGYSLDFEEEDGKIKAANFIQPNGTFKVPKKD